MEAVVRAREIGKESEVRSYCRNFPVLFDRALGVYLYDSVGNRFLDFLSGCGSLNYGHNNPALKDALLAYLADDGVTMSMDMRTTVKERFIEFFHAIILEPRGFSYKLQFPGPTGTNAIEAAVKLARKVTGRSNVICFTNGFHGCTLGALALTGSAHHRSSSHGHLHNVTRMPYDGYFDDGVDTSDMLETMLDDPSSGVDAPAAIIFEVVQGEGGLNACSPIWAQKIQALARRHGAALIIDDIQAGCGRTGNFFSFEPFDIRPDMICLAKAISGFGLPMSLVLLGPEWDAWSPGEHNGTFRGNNLAFLTASEALKIFWQDDRFECDVQSKVELLRARLSQLAQSHGLSLKGRGLMSGLAFKSGVEARAVQSACFERRLVIECSGPDDEVLKPLPALTISDDELAEGLNTISASIDQTLGASA